MGKFSHSSVFRDSIILTVGKFVAGFSNIILLAILSRYLSKSDYGTYRQIWLIITILPQILLMGIPTSINFFLAGESKERQRFYLSQTLLITFALSLLLTSSIALFQGKIGIFFNNPDLPKYINPVLIALFAAPFFYLYQPALVAVHKVKSSVWLSIAQFSGLLLFVGAAILISGNIWMLYISISLFSILLLLAILINFYSTFDGFTWKMETAAIKRQLIYSIPLGLALTAELINKFTDKLIIGHFFDPERFAVYANGALTLPFVGYISGSAVAILIPEFVKFYKSAQYGEISRIWQKSISLTSYLIMPFTVFSLFFAKEIIVLMFSEKYLESWTFFFLYSLILPLRVTIFHSILSSIDKNRIIFNFMISGLILNLIISLVLVKTIGMIGPTVGTVISTYLIEIGQLLYIRKQLRQKISQMIDFRSVSLFILFSVIAGGFSRCILHLSQFNSVTLSLIIGGIIFSLVYFILSFRMIKGLKS